MRATSQFLSFGCRRLATALTSRRTLLLVVLIAMASHLIQPEARNANYRLGASVQEGWRLARRWAGFKELRLQDSMSAFNEDYGQPLLLGICYRVTTSREALASSSAAPVPRLYFDTLIAIDAAMLVLLYVAFAALFGRAIGFTVFVLYDLGFTRFLSFSGDVYPFHFYASVFVLAAFVLLSRSGWRSMLGLMGCAIGLQLCEGFRSGASLVAAGSVVWVVKPALLGGIEHARRVRRSAFGFVIGVFALGFVTSAVIHPPKHLFWHAIHCGLLEFGGYQDGKGYLYPYFANADSLARPVRHIERWNDGLEVEFVQRVDAHAGVYTPRYEKVLRSDMGRLVKTYPLGMIRLVGRRLWRLLLINPWQATTDASEIVSRARDPFIKLFWLALFIAAAWIRIGWRTLLVCAALLPPASAPILIHSGYTMYNLAAQLPLCLFGVCAAAALIRGRLARSLNDKSGQAATKMDPQ